MVRYMTGNSGEEGQRRSLRMKYGGVLEEEGLCGVHVGEVGGKGQFGKGGGWGERMALLVGEGIASAVDGEEIEMGGGGGGGSGARRRSAE